MKRSLVVLLFIPALACNALAPTATFTPAPTAVPTATLPPDLTIYGNIKIIGSEEFVAQTRAALALLEAKDNAAFNKIQAYVGIIQQGEHSGMWAWEVPPRYEVADPTAFYSLTWYASTIAHDATHSELYQQYAAAHPGEAVPELAYGGVENERFCNGYQLEVLKRIGAPQDEIDYLAAQDGTHCDVDEDGDCDWDDYQNRDW